MHLPPAVSHSVVRSRWHLLGICVIAVVTCLATCALLWHEWGQPGSRTRGLLFLAALLISALGALDGWYRSPIGRIHWDGAEWFWTGSGRAPLRQIQEVFITLDLQSLVLVQICSDTGGSCWIFLQEGTQRAQWLALRRALVGAGAARSRVKSAGGLSADNDLLGVSF